MADVADLLAYLVEHLRDLRRLVLGAENITVDSPGRE
jgi:hypothetical protein